MFLLEFKYDGVKGDKDKIIRGRQLCLQRIKMRYRRGEFQQIVYSGIAFNTLTHSHSLRPFVGSSGDLRGDLERPEERDGG